MDVFLVLLIPVLLMVFALLMERVESRLRTPSVTAGDVEQFLDQADQDEVDTFIREGWGGAMDKFRRRRRRRRRGQLRRGGADPRG